MASNVSSIAQALAGKATLLTVPNSASPNSSVQQGIAESGRKADAMGLLTPPNSISPNLPPQAFVAVKYAIENAGSPISQVESDIDLQDAVDHAKSQERRPHGLSAGDDLATSEGVGIITPMYLAKFHLAELVLEKGPIAIRHVMNHLAHTVAGFSEIPPAKARRIVVAALESRTGGGTKGDVEFEKVGWGRWDARVRGQPAKTNRSMYPIREGDTSQSHSMPSAALRIPGGSRRPSYSRRRSQGSWVAEAVLRSRSEVAESTQHDVAEDEADKMSIDGDEDEKPRRTQSTLAIRRSPPENYSDTDEEDWASMGVEALRKSSYSSSASAVNKPGIHSYMRRSSVRRSISFSPHPSSVQNNVSQQQHSQQSQQPQQQQHQRSGSSNPDNLRFDKLDFTGIEADSQEREAIQALLRMGSL